VSAPNYGQIAYAVWHGMDVSFVPFSGIDDWPANDRIVQRWERVGAAVAAAAIAGTQTAANDAPEPSSIPPCHRLSGRAVPRP
jgi:hypothetical protein